jgi:hypothetical protein
MNAHIRGSLSIDLIREIYGDETRVDLAVLQTHRRWKGKQR